MGQDQSESQSVPQQPRAGPETQPQTSANRTQEDTMKQIGIGVKIKLVEKEVQSAKALKNQGKRAQAKQLFIACAEALMKIKRQTTDDEQFQQILDAKITVLLDLAQSCADDFNGAASGQRRGPVQLNQGGAGGKSGPSLTKSQSAHQLQPFSKSQTQRIQPSDFGPVNNGQGQRPETAGQRQARQIIPPGSISDQEKKEILDKLDKEMCKVIMETVIEKGPGVKWTDIQGLSAVKQALKENIILPQLRPDVFSGIRAPTRGILFYGPPGNGKTMLAKAVATECKCTFFSISASTLMSKWVGESEKLMRTLFALAQVYSPSIVFIDEIDSILTARSSSENEAARRMKTEFLIQIDGVGSGKGNMLVIGATNRPFDLDEAALRRLTKRIYIGLPDAEARHGQILKLLKGVSCKLSEQDMKRILALTECYSSADLTAVVKDVAMGPLRDIPADKILTMKSTDLRPVKLSDFERTLREMQPSVSQKSIKEYDDWHKQSRSVQ